MLKFVIFNLLIMNLRKKIPIIVNNIQNNLTEIDLDCMFGDYLFDFLIDRRDFIDKDNTYFLCPLDEEKMQKAATEKWNSLSLNEKKDIVSNWAKTFFGNVMFTQVN